MTTQYRAARLAFAALILTGSATAAAAMNCAPREAIATALAINHGEAPVSGGLRGDNQLLEVFVSDEKQTWTIVVTQTNGVACIVAAGTDWMKESILPVGVPG